MNSLTAIGILILITVTVLGLLLSIAHLITRHSKDILTTKDKERAYECGLEGVSSKSSRVSSGFYLTAVLFVLFDIEIIFLYPWALAYRDFLEQGEGILYLGAFLIFIALFLLGLFWEIRVKALNWR